MKGRKTLTTSPSAACGQSENSLRFATTCNFDGAWKPGEKSKWLTGYNPYFAGKFVIVFQDNDESGETWAQAVAQNVSSYAHTVKIVRLPGLPAKGDVSDWLVNHTAKELEAEIAEAPSWKPVVTSRSFSMFQDAVQFASEAETTVDWLAEGDIPRAGNEIIGGHPKAAKSFSLLILPWRQAVVRHLPLFLLNTLLKTKRNRLFSDTVVARGAAPAGTLQPFSFFFGSCYFSPMWKKERMGHKPDKPRQIRASGCFCTKFKFRQRDYPLKPPARCLSHNRHNRF